MAAVIDSQTRSSQAAPDPLVEYVDVDGVMLRVATRPGEGVPLLLFNGIGANFELVFPFMDALRDKEIIIFDMPPVLACDDVLAFCPDVDSVLLVVAEGQTDRAALGKTMGLLAETNLLGVVLNKSDEPGDSDAYGYY